MKFDNKLNIIFLAVCFVLISILIFFPIFILSFVIIGFPVELLGFEVTSTIVTSTVMISIV